MVLRGRPPRVGKTAGVVVPLSSRLDTSQLRKARGAFFTPEPVARFVTDWALRSASDHVLELSCGEREWVDRTRVGIRKLARVSCS